MTEIDRNKLRALAMAAVEAYDCWLDSNSNKNPPDETIQIDGTTMLALLDQIDGLELGLNAAKLINKKNTELIAALEVRNKRMEEAFKALIMACDNGRHVEIGGGGMTIDAQIDRTIINGIKARAVEEAREALESKP